MRTDNDTWDITTSVGSTALFVAAARAIEARKPDPLAVDAYAEVFCRAVGGEWADLLDGKAPEGHRLTGEFGKHFVNFQGARTRYFDAYFTAAAAAGIRQIVLLAAGLDSRAYRLDWPDDTVVYELDQPRVLAFKREVLSDRGETPTALRREVAVDLRDDWAQALTDAGFDRTRPSAWIAEGLLIYLPAAAQDSLFAGIDALSAPGSRVALEEAAPMPREALAAKQEEERAADEKNRFFTLIYNEQHAPGDQYFAERGWSAEVTKLGEYLTRLQRPVTTTSIDVVGMVDSGSLVTLLKP